MRRILTTLAALGSAGLLLGAFGFQYLGDLPPCKMCIWQRYPHVVAIVAGGLAWLMPWRVWAWIGAAAAAATAGIGIFHVGVEQGWWEGPSTCSSGDITGLSTEDLFNQIMTAPIVRCDEIAWSMAGISMAGWNAIISLVLMVLWLLAARAKA